MLTSKEIYSLARSDLIWENIFNKKCQEKKDKSKKKKKKKILN